MFACQGFLAQTDLQDTGAQGWSRQIIEINQISTPHQVESVRDLIREFTAWAFRLDADAPEAPTFKGLEQELAALPGVYGPPRGRFLLAERLGDPAGCVASRALDQDTAELKRMFVRPEFRGQKIGQLLTAALIEEVSALGFRRIVLDSHHTMKGAHAIYRSAGFQDVDAPADFPKELSGKVVHMEMSLV